MKLLCYKILTFLRIKEKITIQAKPFPAYCPTFSPYAGKSSDRYQGKSFPLCREILGQVG
jgi:hypothetical protein